MRQILYVSLSTVQGDQADLATIREQSRHNNALEDITGLLWSDGRGFMQALEGPRASIALIFARIAADPRHHSLHVVSDRRIEQRDFDSWTMVHRRSGDAPTAHDAQIARLLARASPFMRNQFLARIAVGTTMSVAIPPQRA